MRKDITVVDLFSGAGGLAHGAIMAGLPVSTAVEMDKYAAATYHKNHPQTKLLQKDVRGIGVLDLPKNSKLKILMGGPPCQGFSSSNQKTRSIDNPDLQMVSEFVRIAKVWRPDVILFENVRGFHETYQGKYFNYLCDSLSDLKYGIKWGILDSSKYGIPQIRNRFFLIATLRAEPPNLPKGNGEIISVRQAFSGLPTLLNGANQSVMPYRQGRRSKYAIKVSSKSSVCFNNLVTQNAPSVIERYKYIPQGGNWADIPIHLMGNYKDMTRCHTGIYKRLVSDAPSVVIGNYRKNMLIHPTENRGLSVREAARLQSFSDDYIFEGPMGFQQQQVGNAVPPLLAKAVFEKIISLF